MKKPSTSLFKSALIIFLSFLLTSTGHLAWLYHLMEQTTAQLSNQLTSVGGYLLQAAGIGLFMLLTRRGRVAPRIIFVVSLIVYAVFLVPAVLGTSLPWTILFGSIISLFCGLIAGYYLYEMTENAPDPRRALSFGLGYGAATIASWLLSLVGSGAIYYGGGVLITCLVLTALTITVVFVVPTAQYNEPLPNKPQPKDQLRKPLWLAVGVVFLFSLVNNIGFAFPASDVQSGVHLEFSRMFYGAGLIAAGFVTDKSRKYGAVCALAALVIPFITLALRGEPISSTVFWALGYLAFGFYSVYRAILFSDIAKERGLLWLSAGGLLIGRLGDALGAEINALFIGRESVLVVAAAVLFVAAVFLFIKLFQLLYVPAAARQKSEQEVFAEFASRHDLSGREREVLRLVLDEKTNKEISNVLSVSESTVKFHIHNLLSKTGCKSRTELMSHYYTHRKE